MGGPHRLRASAIALLLGSGALLSSVAPLPLFAQSARERARPLAGHLITPSSALDLRVVEIAGVPQVALPDLTAVLRGVLHADEPGTLYTYRIGDQAVRFSVEAPVATIGDSVVDLPASPIVIDSIPYVPVELVLTHLLGPAGWTGEWIPADRTLRVAPATGAPRAVSVSVAHSGETSKVVFTLDGAIRWEVRKDAMATTVTFLAPNLSPPWKAQDFTDPIVERVTFAEKSATVAFRRGSWAVDAYALSEPFRVVVDVQPVVRELGGIRFGRSASPAPGSSEPPPSLRTIVLDAGHGGSETGAIGPGQTMEKDLTLALCSALRAALESRGYRVLLTRDSDAQVPLEDRPAFANHNKADLFISIHLNASPGKRPRGAEVYYLSLSATDDSARQLAASENDGSFAPGRKPAGGEDLDYLLWDLVQNEHVRESAGLAEQIQNQLNELAGLSNRGIKQAPFRVLVGAAMPAVLVEAAFITNPDEERQLQTPEFRRRVADAIANGIEAYRATIDPAFARRMTPEGSPAPGSLPPSGGALPPGPARP